MGRGTVSRELGEERGGAGLGGTEYVAGCGLNLWAGAGSNG